MKDIFYAIADFFEYIFNVVEILGNIPNYLYIVIISVFLILWIIIMLKHRKDNQEHASL
jgi:tellurite resistance protein TehA-like permease